MAYLCVSDYKITWDMEVELALGYELKIKEVEKNGYELKN